MRVLVCGGRTFDKWSVVRKALDELHEARPISVVIDGDAPGADRLASKWANVRKICNIRVPAPWNHYGKAAGPVRNGWMIDHCSPDMVVAFPGGQGTADMVAKAELAGIEVLKITGPL